MKHINKQPNGKLKKGLSVFLAIVLAAVGFGACSKDDKDKQDNKPTTEDFNPEEYGLILTEDFDISNKDIVRKRAKSIHELLSKELQKQITPADIMQIIYYYNGKQDLLKAMLDDTYKNDAKKVLAVKGLTNNLYLMLQDNISDDVDVLVGNIKKSNKDNEIYDYMFIAGGEEKSYALDFAIIIAEQLKNIENFDSKACNETAKKYYKYFIDVKNNDKLSDELKTIILVDVKAKYGLFTNSGLTKAEITELKKNSFNNTLQAMFDKTMKAWKFEGVLEQMEIDAQENGSFDRNHTQLGESYDKQDSKDSVTHPAVPKEEGTKVSGGGQKVPGSSGNKEVIKQESTTRVEEVTWIEEVTQGTITVNPGKEFVVEITGPGVYEEIEIGGVVVEEHTVSNSYVDADDIINEYYDENAAGKADEMAEAFNKSMN